MYLKQFSQQGIRNLLAGELELNARLNIFYGDNGAGKSSILEAIGLLTTGRSFRTAKINTVLSNESTALTLFGRCETGRRLGLGFAKDLNQKTVKVDGEVIKLLSELAKYFPTQIISPESYHLIDSGPAERRKHLDWCLFHVEHYYHQAWRSFHAVLKQRNALLKSRQNVQEGELLVWENQLVTTANALTEYRKSIVEALSSTLNELLKALTIDFNGEVKLHYYPGYSGEYADKLKENRLIDINTGYTRAGPHNADLKIKIDNELAKDFLSRGQKKVLINALYLSQTLLLKKTSEIGSLFIIDDFTSELDESNQHALLETLLQQKNVQIIISCLQLESLKWLKTRYNNAQLFHVEHGKITAQTQG